MRISYNHALGYSLSLHLLMAALLVAVRAGVPISPEVIVVDWVENVPSIGADEITASPNQGKSSKPIVRAKKPAPAANESGLKSNAETAPATETFSAENKARQLSAEEFYRASVRQTLEQKKIYPPLARRLGQTGTVVLKFILAKDGTLLDAELSSPSPYPVLNEAAKTLLASSKFLPIPDELQRPNWEFTIPIVYRIN